ncbi:MAG: J domain-containing protein [Proteobacteria bacterium]|nr:J domain-containing protein [Pseudomonadota bacterium]MBU1058090.1 J domain-containing protein [Pseudomonadota bacterium]
MTKSEWQDLFAAKEVLGLGDRATLGEIKRSYRNQCRRYHPDLVGNDKKKGDMMRQLTRAYDVILRHCDQFRIPLVPTESEAMEPEDWWMDRFGQDPLWGKKKKN